jgi:hypothetical protein
MAKNNVKPRITIERSDFVIARWTFIVRWRGQGWRTKRCLNWQEALFSAGLLDLHALPSASDTFQEYFIES